MNRRYADIVANVGSNIQDTSTAMQTIIKRLTNDAYFDILRRYNWDFFNHDYSLTTTAGTQDYELPRDFGKELYVLEDTNNLSLTYVEPQVLVRDYPSTWDSQGTVDKYTILKKKVLTQPTSASVVTFVSDNAGDTTQTVFVRGIVDSVEQTDSATLNGTSSVATTKSFTRIIQITKSASSTGKVTATTNSGAVTLASISPEVLDYNAKCVRFHEVPNASLTIQMPYKVNPLPLNDDNDVPYIDSDILEFLSTSYALSYKRKDVRAQEWERKAEKKIISSIWNQENDLNNSKSFDVVPYSRETV